MCRFSGFLSLLGALLSLASLLLTVPARAQEGAVAGVVRDEAGGPLPGVNVWIDETTLGAATDAEGRFRIDGVPAGPRRVLASAVGFRRGEHLATVPPGGEVALTFVLEELTVQSGEVVVTASRRAQLAGAAPLSISALAPVDLERRNVVSLDEALQYVPGVQLAGNQVSIRGSSGFSYNTGSRILLLVDGMPMLRPDMEGLAFDAVPTSQIERIEVLKGPGSALYGGGALGGVVHILTKDFPERAETDVRLFAGAYEPVRYRLWRAQWDAADTPRPLGGLSVAHARRVGERFGFWTSFSYRGDAGYLRLSRRQTFQLSTKLGWQRSPAWRFELLTGAVRRNSDSFLYWNGLRDALNPGALDFGDATATGSGDYLTHEMSLLPSATHVLSPSLFYRLKGRLFGVAVQPIRDGSPAGVETWGMRYGGEVQLNWMPGPGRYLTAGVSGDANATLISFFADDRARSQPEGALFAQYEASPWKPISITAGARLDAYRIRAGEVESSLSPKVSLAYAASDALALRASYGHGFRVPSVTERYVEDRSFFPVVANVDLRPELSTAYEVGARLLVGPPLLRGGLSLDVAAFWTDYERLVEPTFMPRERAFQFVNLTRARVRGVEASAGGSATEYLTFSASYTLLDARDLGLDRPLVFRSRHLLKAGAALHVLRHLEAGLDYRFASRPERVDSDFARFVPDAEITIAQHVVDARVAGQWERLRVALIVRNLFDYYYVERPALLAPPRHAMLQLNLRL